MIVPGQMVEVKWHPNNKEHFVNLGYVFTMYKDIFEVDVNDLLSGQSVLVKVTCDYCNKEKMSKYVKVSNKSNHYCNTSCMFKYKQNHNELPPTTHPYNCDGCGKEIAVENYRYKRLLNGEYNGLYCSKSCSAKDAYQKTKNTKKTNKEKISLRCQMCDCTFKVAYSRRNTAKYCSEKCKRKSSVTIKVVKCDNCGKETTKTASILMRNKNVFCSTNCSNEHKSKINSEIRVCEYCKNEFTCTKSSSKRFCNISCQSNWQSEYLVGENANNFNLNIPVSERQTTCDWCKTGIQIDSPYKLNLIKSENKHTFCSTECRQKWYSLVWSQSDEWREKSRLRAVNNLVEGKISKTKSEPQVLVNDILDSMNVRYTNEYNLKVVSIDNHLTDFNLMIEVMGTYWHTDPRVYEFIKYQMQYDRIMHDKRKRELVKKYGVNLLYLWEKDIIEQPSLCMKLIESYINNNGALSEYNSFNYYLDGVKLTADKIFIPYVDYSAEELHELFIPVDGEKKSYKQVDKWITFYCENCNCQTEQLKSRFRKSNNHFCSKECHYEFMKGKSKYR
ncbi:MAG: hypothetical protein ABTA16_16120 [Niallia sp.]